jgi:hypothetical protein
MSTFKKRLLAVMIVMALLFVSASVVSAAGERIKAQLEPVGGSGVHGKVKVTALDDGAHIRVVAKGLVPGESYVSLYYDNHTCELEPYSEDDVIGGEYVADEEGVGTTAGDADDPIDEVNSVSVRRASDFALLACADLHP